MMSFHEMKRISRLWYLYHDCFFFFERTIHKKKNKNKKRKSYSNDTSDFIYFFALQQREFRNYNIRTVYSYLL